jgi:DNA-binding NarL/FixJ family response regulator
VFVLTTSRDERDVVAAYERNVAGYLVKDNVGDGLDGLLRTLDCFRNFVQFPPESSYVR